MKMGLQEDVVITGAYVHQISKDNYPKIQEPMLADS
jgi:hypothetical protein